MTSGGIFRYPQPKTAGSYKEIFMSARSLPRVSRTLVCLSLLVALPGCSEEKPAEVRQMPPPLVTVMDVVQEDVPLQSTYMGQTLGYLSVEVRAQVSGILMRRAYKEGDYVQQGQLLFEIDPAPVQAALEQAKGQLSVVETQYNNAKRELDRILPLYSRNAVSQRDRDTAQTAFESARAQVESAQARVNEVQIQLGYTKVVAPISGYTSREARNEGNLITLDPTGSLLTTINQTDPMNVTFAIPSGEMMMMKRMEAQNKAVSYKEGAQVSLRLLEGEDYPITGVVTFIDTQVDPYTSVVRARAQFPNPYGVLLPGQYASATLRGTKLLDAVMIPQKAVMHTAAGPMVYVVDAENRATLNPVVLGNTFGSEFLLEGGLKPGDKIVVEGINKVIPDGTVVPKPMENTTRDAPLSTPDSVPPVSETDADVESAAQALAAVSAQN